MYGGMNRKETQGLAALVVVAVLGVSAQSYMRHRERGDLWVEHMPPSSEQASLAASAGESPGATAHAPPSKAFREDGRLDLNLAEASDLERLVGIGPKRSEAILAVRRQKGRFTSSKDLMEVPGIAEKTWRSLDPLVYVEAPAEEAATPEESSLQPLSSPFANEDEKPPGEARVDVNRATAEELETLWNIGSTKAEAILRWRRLHGPFTSLRALELVPGIGPETIQRNSGRIVLGRGVPPAGR